VRLLPGTLDGGQLKANQGSVRDDVTPAVALNRDVRWVVMAGRMVEHGISLMANGLPW
jgi:hypothetical protein